MQAPYLWLIPLLPLAAAGMLALAGKEQRLFASIAAVGSLAISFVLSLLAFFRSLEGTREYWNFVWIRSGTHDVKLGFVLDPLSASMSLMVTFVGLVIFIYSLGYMREDERYTKFFCFLSLFAAGMLGLVVSNSLLLLFICWEIVGVASYLLIGFWFAKPSAAAAAKKAFIMTRIGDLGFFLGLLWLYAATGTQIFYDRGAGCLDGSIFGRLVFEETAFGMSVATGIGLLLVMGAVGKSGQAPLHTWLPDAMEGPTPVSALIHAATMVAAGIYLLARVYPLLDADPLALPFRSSVLTVVTWIGAITAVIGALAALAQTDIKRILAYSTISQLGYMMLGLGTGGVAVGMFHLITHAFFKALLFLGAGSVIHGCEGEQDIQRLGGLKERMPITFTTYAVGMMALAGLPLFFSGFWSKDQILHSAMAWPVAKGPFVLGMLGVFLTAFYMMRQVLLVFYGRSGAVCQRAHESSAIMTLPLIILAILTVLLSFIGTPAWPWFQTYMSGQETRFTPEKLFGAEFLLTALLSTILVVGGLGIAWKVYRKGASDADAVEAFQPRLYRLLQKGFFLDEFYAGTVVRSMTLLARAADGVERTVVGGLINIVRWSLIAGAWTVRLFDLFVINRGFDQGCSSVRNAAHKGSRVDQGQVQAYLGVIGIGSVMMILLLAWGCSR